MPLPAAARLVEFSTTLSSEQPRRGIQTFTRSVPPAVEVVVDREAERVAAAFLRGRNEGLDTARSEYQSKLAQAEASFEERLAAQRSLWAGDQGAALSERIDLAFEALGTDVGDAVAAILAPFVEETLRARIVEELLRTLEKTLKGGRPASLKMSGPEDILESIRRTLGDSAAAIEFEATDDIDVRVVADRTVIETQLEAWLRRISGRNE
jgi:hypothetical protein